MYENNQFGVLRNLIFAKLLILFAYLIKLQNFIAIPIFEINCNPLITFITFNLIFTRLLTPLTSDDIG